MNATTSCRKPLAHWIARDARGENYFAGDRGLREGLPQYLDAESLQSLWPQLERLGELAGGEIDRLADLADKHPPMLHDRDRFGRDEQRIEYHPAYRELERYAYQEFGIHRAQHTPGLFGRATPWPPLAKYALQYLFVQGEFGVMCPVSMADTGWALIDAFADEALKERLRPHLMADNMDNLWRCAHLMTERGAGSDVGNLETCAERIDDGSWQVSGDKWFCSNTDAEVILVLARTAGAPAGTSGLSMFFVPKTRRNGARNSYRIMRLKEKLGTRDMPSGEIVFDRAEAHLIGDEGRGIKQIMRTVNLSRFSHGVRAAAMMRRCWNEAKAAAESRIAFGQRVADFPLMRRQLLKILVPTEQALSAFLFSGWLMGEAENGSAEAQKALRIVTSLFKFRACRDNVPVATGAMEVRGGNGYIEDWINPRLIRDAHVGLLWEGTSNINGLDVLTRAIPKERAHEALEAVLCERLAAVPAVPQVLRGELLNQLDRAVAFGEATAANEPDERYARQVASGLYHAMTALLLAAEGATSAAGGGDARRLLLARMVLDHRLKPRDPLSLDESGFDAAAEAVLCNDTAVPLDKAERLLTL